jgi:hypothetical protein
VIERIHAAQKASKRKTFDTAPNAIVSKIFNPADQLVSVITESQRAQPTVK